MNASDTGPGRDGASFNAGELSVGEFITFFKEVHGYDPFPWQQRLTAQVLDGSGWPKVVDLPTGAGKTAILDTAIFAMAARPATSPRRIVFVIDRRIVVDQVYLRAEQIQKSLKRPGSPVVQQVRDRLREMSDGEDVLGIAALRGGIPVDADWTERPDQPWVVVSTVDQFGSRLLFRGYGVSKRMRPVHAGLTGNDCLVILDEVHLSVPFAQTLAQVAALPSPSDRLPRRFKVIEMSATPSNRNATRFKLDPEADLEGSPELGRRLNAPKQAELVGPVRDHRAVPGAVLKILKSISKKHSNIRSVGVVVNRVQTARETHSALAKNGHVVHLITGRMRPLDRLDTLDRIFPIVDPDVERHDDELSIVVATQAIEVGADFSFDALITECAPVDSLRQRFGRLDRRGAWYETNDSPAKAWIIGTKSAMNPKKPDPIYGAATRVTWDDLVRRSQEGLQEAVEVGAMALRDFPNDAIAPGKCAPLILQTHLDAWVQTNPEPIVQPTVDWFLHGIEKERPADVSVLWRWDRATEALRMVPPRQSEMIQVPVGAVKSWLESRQETDIADAGHIDDAGRDSAVRQIADGDWVRWNGSGEGADEKAQLKEILPGDTVVVNPECGGLSAGTWDPAADEKLEDLGDRAQFEHGRRVTLRLDARLGFGESPPTPSDEAEAATPLRSRVADWLKDQNAKIDQKPGWLQETLRRLLGRGFDVETVGVDEETPGSGYYILAERTASTDKPLVDATTLDGSDEAGSHTGTGVALDQHLEGVGKRAGKIAERLGLPPDLVADINLAGQLHDLGKVDTRFQLRLVGGDPVEMEMRRDEPLAKSLPGARRGRSSYPKGMRHELASVAMVQSNDAVLASASDKDLVLHLVGTHHGWGRPLPPIVEDPASQVLSYSLNGQLMETSSNLAEGSLALEMADRFWRLVERYGYHGLAWLEAILRLSDHQQSAEESRLT